MKKKSPPYAIIGAFVFGIACILIFWHIQKQQEAETDAKVAAATKALQDQLAQEKTKPTTTVTPMDTDVRPVLYATQPVEAGIRISPAFYEKKNTPKDIMPDAYTGDSDIVGWYAIRKIEKGDPLTPRNIGKSVPYMSQRIPPGMREISLPIFNSEVNDAGGYIVDGDHVDLLYTSNSPNNAFVLKVETVLQDLSILSTPGSPVKSDKTDGINQVPPPGSPMSVTFEVTPEQAQILVFLSSVKTGRFSMILRGRSDNEILKIKPFAAQDYPEGFKKVQRVNDKSIDRVKELAQEIEAKEKAMAAPGTTNENTTPNPPNP